VKLVISVAGMHFTFSFTFLFRCLFLPKLDVCPTLELDVKQTLDLDVNLTFIFNQNHTTGVHILCLLGCLKTMPLPSPCKQLKPCHRLCILRVLGEASAIIAA